MYMRKYALYVLPKAVKEHETQFHAQGWLSQLYYRHESLVMCNLYAASLALQYWKTANSVLSVERYVIYCTPCNYYLMGTAHYNFEAGATTAQPKDFTFLKWKLVHIWFGLWWHLEGSVSFHAPLLPLACHNLLVVYICILPSNIQILICL